MSKYPLPRILEFMRTVEPFDTMNEDELHQMVSQMEIAYYPRGQMIIRRGDEPSCLHIICVGSARISISDESKEDILVDVLGEGETFGATNVLDSKKSVFDISSDEDMIAYLLPADVFKEIVASNPDFNEYFSYSLARSIRAAHKFGESAHHRSQDINTLNLDMFLIGKRVSDLMFTDVLTCTTDDTIRSIARKMTDRKVSSIVVTESSGQPLGIVTDSDLRSKIIAEGLSMDTSVEKVMSYPLYTISPDAYAFDALLDMSRYNISHLLVAEQDRLAGIISDHDFQMETGSSPVGVIGDIEKSQTIEDIIGMHSKIDRVLEMLVRQGGSVKRMVALVTELNDRVTRKIIKLTQQEMEAEGLGTPPAPYTWMALGSEGRREQTLLTDQDNALLFLKRPEDDQEKVKKWFLMFSERVVKSLVKYGFPRCPGGIMASNPRWCQSEYDWEKTFLGWINEPEPFTLRMATIFFDFRPIYAETDFLENFRDTLNDAIKGNKHFLRSLANIGLFNRPPLGFLRQFVVEKSGEHKNKLNLKIRGLAPVVDTARVMALDMGISTTNTHERLELLRDMDFIESSLYKDVREAYDFINLLRISHHLKARSKGELPDNFVDPEKLNNLQRRMLKESFAVINTLLQELIEWRYQVHTLEEA